MEDLKVTQDEFNEWCRDHKVPEEDLDTTSRHLAKIEQYAEERAEWRAEAGDE